MKFAVQPDEEICEGLVRVMRGQVRKLRLLSEAEAFDEAEFVKAARLVGKRMRAALQLCRPVMGEKPFRQMNRWWRDQARTLSSVRDLAARVEALDALAGDLEPMLGVELPQALRTRFAEELYASQQREEAGQDPVSAFRQALADAPSPDPDAMKPGGQKQVFAAYAEGYRRARKAMKAAIASGDVALYHEWRKPAKRHALQTRLLRRLSPSLESRIPPTRKLAERLGMLQDISVTLEALMEMQAPSFGETGRIQLGVALGLLQERFMEEARQAGADVFNLRRRAFIGEFAGAGVLEERGTLV